MVIQNIFAECRDYESVDDYLFFEVIWKINEKLLGQRYEWVYLNTMFFNTVR